MKFSKAVSAVALIVLGFVGTQLFVEGSGIQTIAYNLIQNAGTPLTKRSTLNFTGAGVTCSDGSSKTTCDIPGGGGGGANTVLTIANEGVTGTTVNKLASITGAPSTAKITAGAATGGVVGICTSGCGTTSNATITIAGQLSCVFDGATTAGHYVQISASTAGDCTDGGATYPTSGQVLGRVLSTNVAGGTFTVDLFPSELQPGGGGGGGIATNAGLYASRPAAGNAGNLYFATDGNTISRDTGAAWQNFGPIYFLADPTTLTWTTWGDSGASPTATSAQGGKLFSWLDNQPGTSWVGMRTSIPAAPFTIIAGIQLPLIGCGLMIMDSGSSAFQQVRPSSNGMLIDRWTPPGTFGGTDLNVPTLGFNGYGQGMEWLKVQDDGVNRVWYQSADGIAYNRLLSQVSNFGFTPNTAGVSANSNGGGNIPWNCRVSSFSVTTP